MARAKPHVAACSQPTSSLRMEQDGEFFRRVLESLPYPQYLIDAKSLAVLWCSSAVGLKTPETEVKCHELIHNREKRCDKMGYLCLLQQARKLNRFVLAEETITDRDGTQIHVEFQGFPIRDSNGDLTHLLESRVDISKRKRAERALFDSEQKYRMLFQEANDAIFLVDVESGYILNANREAERLLGVPASEILVMHQVELFNPQTLDLIEREEHSPRHNGSTVEAEIVRKDGLAVPVSISSSSVTLHGRKLVQRVLKDVTPYKEAEAKRIEYQGKLRSLASRLSLAQEHERRRIAAQVHDSIGQTLAVCSMKIGSLSQSLANTPMEAEAREIERHLKQTIEETRRLAYEISSPLLYEIGIEAAVDRLTEEFRNRFGINFSYVHEGELGSLENDIRVTIFQVVRELLVNAAKHSGARHVNVVMRTIDGYLHTTVTDDGHGFDPHRTANNARIQGYGLFSIGERLESVGGDLNIDSRQGRGSRIEFSVPLKKAPEARTE